jgi:glycosyltransferase involved in cell wall biosynthesis
MIRLIKKERPQIVHTHTPKAGLIGMLAAWFCSVPVRLHTVGGLPLMETKGYEKKILIWIEKLTYASAHYVYPNSLELKKYILQNKFTSAEKLKVLGNGSSNGIDTDHFKRTQVILSEAEKLRTRHSILPSDLLFIFIGRIVKDKGINELADAFHQLSKKYPCLKLLLAGDFEDDLDPISANAKQIINSNSNIICPGFIQDVRPYLAASNVLVFPSYREGFPNVPLQAGCMELPMIVTDINGCNEIVQDGINGLIVPAKNVDALKTAMEKMITDEKFRQNCASASRQAIVKNYSRETIWNELLQEYETLLLMKGINFTHVSKIPEAIT